LVVFLFPLGGLPEPPGYRAVEMFRQVLTAIGEFLADEADPIEVGPHRELLVFDLRLPCAGAFLAQGLIIQG
jgi:hypothetical protein